MEPYVGEVRMFTGDYAPINWAICNGEILQISQYESLFAVMGNTYGGDGRTTFALPDFRGRIPVGSGQGAGLTNRNLGDTFGTELHTFTEEELPAHTHTATVTGGNTITATLNASGDNANEVVATNNYLADTTTATYLNNNTNAKQLNAGAVSVDTSSFNISAGNSGGTESVPFIQPMITITYIIALQGIFPSRN